MRAKPAYTQACANDGPVDAYGPRIGPPGKWQADRISGHRGVNCRRTMGGQVQVQKLGFALKIHILYFP